MSQHLSAPRDSGSATVLGVALICLCLVGGVGAVAFGQLAWVRARVSSAADLAALAGAAHVGYGDECTAATRVAALGGARLASCDLDAGDVTVVAVGEVHGLVGAVIESAGRQVPQIRVRSRAGPSSGDDG